MCLFSVVPECAKNGIVGQPDANLIKFTPKIADIPCYVMTDDELAIGKIPVDFIGMIQKGLSAGQLF